MSSQTRSHYSQKHLIIGSAIAVLLVAMVFLQFKTPDTIEHERSAPLVLTSDDGTASLNIPDGALPDGVSVSDISMKIVSSTAISDDGLDRIVVALEPDGIQLRAPATLTFALDPLAAGEPLRLPLVLHLSGVDSIEAIDEVTIAFDEETGEGTLSVAIEHFSLISYERALALFTVSVVPTSGSFAVGETFNRTLAVTPKTGSYKVTSIPWGENRKERSTFMEATYGIANGTRWKLENRTYDMLVNDEDVLAPKMYNFGGKGYGGN